MKKKMLAELKEGEELDPTQVPIEKVRLRSVPFFITATIICTIGYVRMFSSDFFLHTEALDRAGRCKVEPISQSRLFSNSSVSTVRLRDCP